MIKTPYIALFLIIVHSCSNQVPDEITALTKVIDQNFADIPTGVSLISFKVVGEYQYEEFPIDFNKNSEKDIPRRAKPPIPGEKDALCQINFEPFNQLIKNELIDELDFINLMKASKRAKDMTYSISTDSSIEKTLNEVLKDKTLEKFQHFAYPIMTEKHLIICRNVYDGIDSYGAIIGAGYFFIYEKRNGQWVLIHRVLRWTT